MHPYLLRLITSNHCFSVCGSENGYVKLIDITTEKCVTRARLNSNYISDVKVKVFIYFSHCFVVDPASCSCADRCVKERLYFLVHSVVDPDPDPHGSGTFAWIRIRN